MNLYTVSVDSSGYSGDYNESLIVIADNVNDAGLAAQRFTEGKRREVLGVEVYALDPSVYPSAIGANVIGRLLNTDEE